MNWLPYLLNGFYKEKDPYFENLLETYARSTTTTNLDLKTLDLIKKELHKRQLISVVTQPKSCLLTKNAVKGSIDFKSSEWFRKVIFGL